MRLKKHSIFIFLFGDLTIPRYIPFYYRLYLLCSKLYRSIKKKLPFPSAESQIILEDDPVATKTATVLGPKQDPFINKTYSDLEQDFKRKEIKNIIQDIDELKRALTKKELKFTNAAGNFKSKDFIPEKEKNKMWENTWILAHSKTSPQHTILDIGGASTIFSFFLASLGCKVYVVDNDAGSNGIIYNSRYVASRMNWKLVSYRRDIFKGIKANDNSFDKVFCICVLEHLSSSLRKRLMKEISRVLKPGGLVGITFDYDKERNSPGLDKGIRYSFKERLVGDIIEPSGLEVYGNEHLIDDCSPDFFLGAFFLKKKE